MNIQGLLAKLIEERKTRADNALLKPQGTGAFEYGFAAGVSQGLQIAIQRLLDMQRDEKERDL